MATTLLMVGTRKGLWIATSNNRIDWAWTGPHFAMEEVYSCMVDRRAPGVRLLAGASSSWLGPQVWRSDDLGTTWEGTPNGAIRFPEGAGATVERVWQLQPGVDQGVVWAGTEPGAVFKSTDRGETFELLKGLWDHPHRADWAEGFGGQAFHTLLPHPTDPDRLLAAISTGGVYLTTDGGDTWTASNTGIKAEFMPRERHFPEFGQCVHKVARDSADPDRLYLQNHGGVYRSDDGGVTWSDIAAGLPSEFGFPVVAHPHRGDTAYVFPIAGAEQRWPVDARARVCRTRDAGSTWEPLGEGQLPDNYYAAVMRDAMCVDDHEETGIYFGGRNGSLWASTDEGDSWREIRTDLPDILVVRAASVLSR